MNQEQINELRQLAQAATPGPWAYTTDSNDFPVNGYVTVRDCIYSVCILPYEGIRTDDRVTDNGLYIAAANPAALLALIAEIDSLRDEVNGLTGELGRERERLDWAVSRESFYDHTTRVFFCDRAFKIPKPQVRIETDNFRATIDELMVQS